MRISGATLKLFPVFSSSRKKQLWVVFWQENWNQWLKIGWKCIFSLQPLSLISMLAHIRGRGWSKWRFSFWFGSWQKNIRWRAMAMLIKRRSGGAFSKRKITFKKVKKMKENHSYSVFRCVLASLYEGLSVRPSVCPSVRPSVRPSVGDAFVKNGKMDDFDRK